MGDREAERVEWMRDQGEAHDFVTMQVHIVFEGLRHHGASGCGLLLRATLDLEARWRVAQNGQPRYLACVSPDFRRGAETRTRS